MGIKVVLADSDSKYMSMLGRALLDAGYILCPAESKETAIKQINDYAVDACIIDIDLPGGIEEILEFCIAYTIPVISIGMTPLNSTDKSVELMYYGIPYVKKYNLTGEAKLDHIIARMNALMKTLLIWSKDIKSQLSVIAMLENKNYKVFAVDNPSDVLHTFLLSEPNSIIVYFPSHEDMKEVDNIRKIDNNLPIILVMDEPSKVADKINADKSIRVVSTEEITDYLSSL
jgi:DNA-binding response OmpR family regulator